MLHATLNRVESSKNNVIKKEWQVTLGGRTYDSQVILRGRTDKIRGDGQLVVGGTDS